MEEEDLEGDPEEDSKVSEGQLEDLKGDSSECETEQIKGENPGGDHEEEKREFIMQDDQTRGPESLGAEIDSDSTKRRDEFVTGIICWKRGRCSRMCRGTGPLDTPDQQKFIAFRKLVLFLFSLRQYCQLPF